MEDFIKPKLIEPGVKSFLNHTLHKCRQFKNKYNNLILNISLFVGLFVILFFILIFKYKGKPTPEEVKEKELIKQQYILSKVKNFQHEKLVAQQKLITGLPHWETEYDIIHKKNQ